MTCLLVIFFRQPTKRSANLITPSCCCKWLIIAMLSECRCSSHASWQSIFRQSTPTPRSAKSIAPTEGWPSLTRSTLKSLQIWQTEVGENNWRSTPMSLTLNQKECNYSNWYDRPDQLQCPVLGHWSKWITLRRCRIAGLELFYREGSLCIHDKYFRGDGQVLWTANPGPEGIIRYDSCSTKIYRYP